MLSSVIEQVADASTEAIKKCAKSQFSWTSGQNGAKLCMTKNKSMFHVKHNLIRQILDLEKQSIANL
jgi:hypothetical protein